MSYRTMLKHKCNILELTEMAANGLVGLQWSIIDGGSNVRCYIDLNFLRRGKDPMLLWTPEAGRASDRVGVLFVDPKAKIKTGHRVEIVKGPHGVFSVEGAIDEVWTPRKLHHLEVGVQEVGRPIAKGAPTL